MLPEADRKSASDGEEKGRGEERCCALTGLWITEGPQPQGCALGYAVTPLRGFDDRGAVGNPGLRPGLYCYAPAGLWMTEGPLETQGCALGYAVAPLRGFDDRGAVGNPGLRPGLCCYAPAGLWMMEGGRRITSGTLMLR